MKNTLTYQNSIQHLLSNVDDGTNKLIVDGTEIPSSTWEGTGTFTITSGSATITIEQIENASNIMLQKVSTNNYKLVDAGAAGKVNLESDVTGTLPIGNGGTGSSAGDSKDLITTFTSADDDSIFNSGNLGAQSAYAWNVVSKIDSAEKHSSLFNKISTMFKNIRTIAKFLGTTDISAIGGGTVSGAISALNNSLSKMFYYNGSAYKYPLQIRVFSKSVPFYSTQTYTFTAFTHGALFAICQPSQNGYAAASTVSYDTLTNGSIKVWNYNTASAYLGVLIIVFGY